MGSKSLIMSGAGAGSVKGFRIPKTIIDASNQDKIVKKVHHAKMSGAITPTITYEKIDVGPSRYRNRAVEQESSFEKRSINISIKHKQFPKKIIDSPEITP